LLINLRNGKFTEAATPYGIDSLLDGRGLAVSDFDGDGGLDFITSNYNAHAQYFLNRVPNRGHWLRIRLRGRESNRDGIGAIIRARAGVLKMMRVVTAGDGYASQFSRVAHFGLGEEKAVDELEVTWPSGAKQAFTNIAADQLIGIDEDRPDERLIRQMARK
jgi:hypothetical protein